MMQGMFAAAAVAALCGAAAALATADPPKPPATPAPTVAKGSLSDWESRAKAFSPWQWVTRPSRDSVMGFTLPIDVQELAVQAGQRVAKGQIMVRGRESEMLAGIEVQRTRANNVADVEAARANMDLAKSRKDAGEKANNEGGMSPAEMDERRLTYAAAVAQFESAQARLKEQQQLLLQAERQAERYRLVAPFDGIVDQIVVDVGANVNEQQPVLRVVQVDPLWIDVPVSPEEPIERGLKLGSPAWVLLDAPGENAAREARVLYVAPVVDAGGTLRVRVEVANPRGLPAGTRAAVRFAPPQQAAAPGGEPAVASNGSGKQ